jgi:rhodanese-related sulfurtransferase
MKTLTKTKVWMLAILFISFLVVSCEKEEEEGVDEAQVLIEWLESATSPAADYGNSALAIKLAPDVKAAMEADKVYIIDIRKSNDYNAGHIEGAVNVATADVLDHINNSDLSAFDEIAIVCYSGQEAGWLTCLLKLSGIDNVYSMKWGMCSWNANFAGSWDGGISSDKSTFFTSDVTEKAAEVDLPELNTGKTTAEEIFDVRLNAVMAEGFAGVNILNQEVYGSLDDYYIINYWPEAEYLNPGHIEGAIQYTPNDDLKLDNFLKTLPTDKPIVVYCYSGQESAKVAAYLRVIGYDAKSLKFGANGMIHSMMTKGFWSESQINDYQYVTE